jgi:hypothetical protein
MWLRLGAWRLLDTVTQSLQAYPPRLDFGNELHVTLTDRMWAAMPAADEVCEIAYTGLDPTVSELEGVGCQLSGHEATCFLPCPVSAG